MGQGTNNTSRPSSGRHTHAHLKHHQRAHTGAVTRLTPARGAAAACITHRTGSRPGSMQNYSRARVSSPRGALGKCCLGTVSRQRRHNQHKSRGRTTTLQQQHAQCARRRLPSAGPSKKRPTHPKGPSQNSSLHSKPPPPLLLLLLLLQRPHRRALALGGCLLVKQLL